MINASGVSAPIDVVTTPADRQVTISVRGDVDAASARYLSAALEAAEEAGHLVIDLSATAFVDIAGMRVIVDCATRRNGRGLELVLAAPPPSAMTILPMMPRRSHLCCEPRLH